MADESTIDAYDRVAKRYETRFLDELVDKPRDRELLDGITEQADSPIVEIGCGPGQIGAYLRGRGCRVVGIDVSSEMAGLAAARLDGVAIADMRALPIASDAAGAIVAFYSVIHLPRTDLSGAFREFARVLRPGGRVLVTAHEGEGDITVTEFLDLPVELAASFFSLDELVAAAEAAGIAIQVAERRDPYPTEGQTVRLYLVGERRPPAP